MPDGMIYGINPVLETLRSERQALNKIILVEGKEGGPIRLIRRLAREKGIPIHFSPKEALDRLAGGGHHQGILGFTAASSYSNWEDLLGRIRSARGKAIVLVLDSIEDPQNLGSLIRTAEACGVKGVILPKERAAGITPAVVKASAGAVAHLPTVRVTNLAGALEELKKEGFWIVGADSRAEKSLYDLKFDMDVAVVIGSEAKGVRHLLLKKCDYTVSIPMRGKVSSLNAAIAGAVILFEILRQQFVQNG